MRHQFYVALVLLLISGIARSATIEELPCQNGCADDCIRFNQGTVFVQTESGAKLLHEGTIYDLSRITSRYLRRHQKNAEVAGDVQISTWSSGPINAEVTQTVIDTTCYWRKPNGTYVSAENCCGTNYRVKLKLATPRGKHFLNAIFESGC